jgi:hypothetical protein
MNSKGTNRRLATWYFIGLEAIVACSIMVLSVFITPLGLQVAMAAFGLAIASIAVADIDRVKVSKDIQQSVDQLGAELKQVAKMISDRESTTDLGEESNISDN